MLQSYLLMFVHSAPALQPEHDYEKIVERALNSYTLGEHVPAPWALGKVLKWRKENSADAKARWDVLGALNQKLSRVLLHLSEEEAKHPTAYRKAVKYISTIQSVQVGRVPPLVSREAEAR